MEMHLCIGLGNAMMPHFVQEYCMHVFGLYWLLCDQFSTRKQKIASSWVKLGVCHSFAAGSLTSSF